MNTEKWKNFKNTSKMNESGDIPELPFYLLCILNNAYFLDSGRKNLS